VVASIDVFNMCQTLNMMWIHVLVDDELIIIT